MNTIRISILLILLLLVSACGKDEPTLEQLESYIQIHSRIAKHLGKKSSPDDIAFSEIKVLASERTGGELEPKMTFRIKVELTAKDDLYQLDTVLYNRPIVQRTTSKGEAETVYFLLDAEKKGEHWQVTHDYNYEPQNGKTLEGYPLSAWLGNAVIYGSAEAQELIAKHKAEQEAQRKAAEEKRLKQEAERKAKAAKLAAERKARLEREAKALASRKAALRKALSGTWVSKGAILKNGAIISSKGYTFGYMLEIPDGKELSAKGAGGTYLIENRQNNIAYSTTFTVDPKTGNFVTIKETRGKRLRIDRVIRWSSGLTWQMTMKGNELHAKSHKHSMVLVRAN